MTETEQQARPAPLAATPDDPETRASDELAARVRVLRGVQVPMARRLAGWVRDGKPFQNLAGSLTEFGHQHGLGSPELHRLVAVGMVLRDHPEIEAPLLDESLSLDNASLLYDLDACGGAIREGEDWVAFAVADDHASFRKRVEKRIAEATCGGRVRHLGMWVPDETARKFERARTLASRKAGRMLTRPEAFAFILDDFLRRHDPLFPRKRRKTRRSRASDYVPEAEKQEVRRRFGDPCAVDGCTNEAFLEFAHIRARALGGANAAWNLLLLCRHHHRMFDSGRLFLRGNAGERQWFVDRNGRRVAPLRDPPGVPEATGPPR